METPRKESADRITVRISRDFEDIAPIFLSNRKKDLQTLRHALADKDFKTIEMLGHRMKGDGGGYGFNHITQIGDALELAATRHDSDASDRHIAQLEEFLALVQVEYF